MVHETKTIFGSSKAGLVMPAPAGSDPEMAEETFREICALIYDQAGIKLGPHKVALVKARIGKRMRKLGIADYSKYMRAVHDDSTGMELVEMLDAICTNVTHFFREEQHFEIVGELVREWESRGQTRFRLWCTAASTGEEPYSLAMTLRENLDDTRDALILATDLSSKVLAVARTGSYQEKHMQNVPQALAARYFTREDRGGTGVYTVREEIRRMVRFSRLNLSVTPFPLHGPLDIVFCRNVMIYFDNEVRKRLLDDLYRLIRPGGYLMVGHAESLAGMLSEFKPLQPSVYIRE